MSCIYIDSSVYLRLLFGHRGQLHLKGLPALAASELLAIEVHRTIDRYRLEKAITDRDVGALKGEAESFFRRLELVTMAGSIKRRASEAFPSILGTLDGLHIATALLLREKKYSDLRMATHDTQMQNCARALGFPVLG